MVRLEPLEFEAEGAAHLVAQIVPREELDGAPQRLPVDRRREEVRLLLVERQRDVRPVALSREGAAAREPRAEAGSLHLGLFLKDRGGDVGVVVGEREVRAADDAALYGRLLDDGLLHLARVGRPRDDAEGALRVEVFGLKRAVERLGEAQPEVVHATHAVEAYAVPVAVAADAQNQQLVLPLAEPFDAHLRSGGVVDALELPDDVAVAVRHAELHAVVIRCAERCRTALRRGILLTLQLEDHAAALLRTRCRLRLFALARDQHHEAGQKDGYSFAHLSFCCAVWCVGQNFGSGFVSASYFFVSLPLFPDPLPKRVSPLRRALRFHFDRKTTTTIRRNP